MKNFAMLLVSCLCLLQCHGCASVATLAGFGNDVSPYDVVVYGGTSAGVAAAVQVKRMGGTVIIVEPTQRIGGLTTGGLGQTDIGNKAAIGGISREFYRRVRDYYADPAHWKWQKPEDYRSGGQSRTWGNEDAMWTFEPSAALAILERWVREHEIPVVRGERLDRNALVKDSPLVRGVMMDRAAIVAITTETGNTYHGRTFIDATYEGDLMAGAGVSYRVGREGNEEYEETLNGVQTRRAVHHQFRSGVDPHVEAGNASSGLLPGIDASGPGSEGHGDHRVQAYCFRMCLTDHPENRISFAKPRTYDAASYELLLRNFEAGAVITPWSNSPMPNRKTDTNNSRGFSTDFIGRSHAYPEASDVERRRIVEDHRRYQQGLMWTFAHHPRVPESIRKEVSRWGTCRDEFVREDGWQDQLYIRESRRMVGETVMTQHHCQGRVTAARPVGLAAYTMDSHNVQRYVTAEGDVKNEGDVQVGGFSPYPIDYGSIVPKKDECTNLFVPVCLSATHIAFGSIRMEPVFMVLGQSAATAAVLSVEGGTKAQDVDYRALEERLLADEQVLAWMGATRPTPTGTPSNSLPGIVVDDEAAERDGFEAVSTSVVPFVGVGYRHDDNTGKGRQRARFELRIPRAGEYEVRLSWSAHSNRATNVPVTVRHSGGQSTVLIDQRREPSSRGFGLVGTYSFEAGVAVVEITNAGTDGFVIVDALQLVKPENQ